MCTCAWLRVCVPLCAHLRGGACGMYPQPLLMSKAPRHGACGPCGWGPGSRSPGPQSSAATLSPCGPAGTSPGTPNPRPISAHQCPAPHPASAPGAQGVSGHRVPGTGTHDRLPESAAPRGHVPGAPSTHLPPEARGLCGPAAGEAVLSRALGSPETASPEERGPGLWDLLVTSWLSGTAAGAWLSPAQPRKPQKQTSEEPSAPDTDVA